MLIDEFVQKLACVFVYIYIFTYIYIYIYYIHRYDLCIYVFVFRYIYIYIYSCICIHVFMVSRFIDLLVHVLFTYPRLKKKNRRLYMITT